MKKSILLLALSSLFLANHIHAKEASNYKNLTEELSASKINHPEAWQAYLEKSNKMRETEIAILTQEAGTAKKAKKAPSGGDFKLPNKSEKWFASEEAKTLADHTITYQTPAGGWTKKLDAKKHPREKGMHWSTQSDSLKKFHYAGTFDNRATTEQLYLLAGVYSATKDEKLLASFTKGIQYILDAQFPNGGFPQGYPLEHGYHDFITFNDAAMIHVLEILNHTAEGKDTFSFTSPELREKARIAHDRGIQCLLNAQITINGKKTVWCAQHACISLTPTNARNMEPASLSGGESAAILKYLMSLENPTPQVISAVRSAITWFHENAIAGLVEKKINGKQTYVVDTQCEDLTWARFYDLTTGKPIFPGRDGIIYATFDELAKKNDVGYDYYTDQADELIAKHYSKWIKKHKIK